MKLSLWTIHKRPCLIFRIFRLLSNPLSVKLWKLSIRVEYWGWDCLVDRRNRRDSRRLEYKFSALGPNCLWRNRLGQHGLLWRKYLFRIHFRRSPDTRYRVGNIWRIKYRDAIRFVSHGNIEWLISSSICRSSRRLIRYWLCICFDSCRWSKDHWSLFKLGSYNKLN